MARHTPACIALVALQLLAAAHAAIEATPAIESLDNDMLLRVNENGTIKFAYGSGPGETIDVQDAHSPTISALALGYSIGAQLDKISGEKEESETDAKISRVDLKVDSASTRISDQQKRIDANADTVNGLALSVTKINAVVDALKETVAELKAPPDDGEGNSNSGGSSGTFSGSAAAWVGFEEVVVNENTGSQILFIWPMTTATSTLVVSEKAKIYTVVVSKLDDKGESTGDVREYGPYAAEGDRLLIADLPPWYKAGEKLPSSQYFMASVRVYERGMPMATPDDNKLKITADTPKTNLKDTLTVASGPDSTKFTVEFDIDYAYKAWDDVLLSMTTNEKVNVNNLAIGAGSSGGKGKLSFWVSYDGDDLSFDLTVISASKQSKLSHTQTIKVSWTKVVFGNKFLTASQSSQIMKKAKERVGDKKWVVCFDGRINGWNSNTMHARCTGGTILFVAQRGDNKRLFGGLMGNTRRNSGYNMGRNSIDFMWAESSRGGSISFATQKSGNIHRTYMSDGYAYTYGGGHDLHCNQAFTSCYCNFGHSWQGSPQSNTWCSGSYSWNLRSGSGGNYVVYKPA